MNITSQITFLYFEEYDEACAFFEDTLELEMVHDPGWAKVWRTTGNAFLGAVKASEGSIDSNNKGGFLISLTVKNVDELYLIYQKKDLDSLSEIKYFDDIGLKSFLFKGPEGYDFEIQEFTNPDLRELY